MSFSVEYMTSALTALGLKAQSCRMHEALGLMHSTGLRMPTIAALGRLSQESHKCKVIHWYIMPSRQPGLHETLTQQTKQMKNPIKKKYLSW